MDTQSKIPPIFSKLAHLLNYFQLCNQEFPATNRLVRSFASQATKPLRSEELDADGRLLMAFSGNGLEANLKNIDKKDLL